MNTSSALKPSISLLVTSLLVLAGCLFLIVIAVASFARQLDYSSFISALMILPLPSVLGIEQLRATFFSSRNAAYRAAVLLFITGGFVLLFLAVILGEILLKKVQAPPHLLFSMLAMCVGSCLAAWMDLRWWRQLNKESKRAM